MLKMYYYKRDHVLPNFFHSSVIMPVPAEPVETTTAHEPPQKNVSQKQMTKAERRELQEKQRAAKLLQKQQKPQGVPATASKGATNASEPSPPTPKTPRPVSSGQHRRTTSVHDPSTISKGQNSEEVSRSKSRGLMIFSHFSLPKQLGQGVKGDVHPEVIRLALLFSEFKICGANARCIATLTAFKTVIQDYTTPEHNTLSRHLMTHLSPQISYLVSARPMSVSMGNAIRQLKLEISQTDIDMVEQDAKDDLCQKIDNYIRDRIIVADEVIEELAGQKIKDGDVILTYAKSSVVEKVLLNAHVEGKRFSVIVVDSQPLLEGKGLLTTLTSTNPPIPCTYTLLSAISSVMTEVTTVLVGAHSICANGAVYSRAGTALVAMIAKNHNVPVVVCCETYKFSESIVLDAFGKNELLAPKRGNPTSPASVPSLEVLNPLYDITPPKCITAVVTEVGLIPPSSISSIPTALGRTLM
jgi:translation initiation factor eIF-2B subunit delta